MLLSKKLTALCAVTCCAAWAPVAQAEEFGSRADARAQGDPAGSAGVAPTPDKARYKGNAIKGETAVARGLVCNQDETTTLKCFDTDAQAATASGAKANSARTKKKRGASASCSASDGSELKLYGDSSFGGYQLNLSGRNAWYTVPDFFQDAASSYQMGGHSGHISGENGGNGPWYPGNTAICGQDTYMGRYSYTYPPGAPTGTWNDKASARYRN